MREEHVAPSDRSPRGWAFEGASWRISVHRDVSVPRRDSRRQQRERHENDEDEPADVSRACFFRKTPPKALTVPGASAPATRMRGSKG